MTGFLGGRRSNCPNRFTQGRFDDGVVLQPALPKHQNAPAAGLKRGDLAGVPLHIGRELGLPEIDAGRRGAGA